MLRSARRIEHETPLPLATGFGTSVTSELTVDLADFGERVGMRLMRWSARLCEEGQRETLLATVMFSGWRERDADDDDDDDEEPSDGVGRWVWGAVGWGCAAGP